MLFFSILQIRCFSVVLKQKKFADIAGANRRVCPVSGRALLCPYL